MNSFCGEGTSNRFPTVDEASNIGIKKCNFYSLAIERQAVLR